MVNRNGRRVSVLASWRGFPFSTLSTRPTAQACHVAGTATTCFPGCCWAWRWRGSTQQQTCLGGWELVAGCRGETPAGASRRPTLPYLRTRPPFFLTF